MKTFMTISQHPNQESKTGNAPYASFTQKNFSGNESLPGKAYMKVVRMKRSNLSSIFGLMTRLYRRFADKAK